jgi:hypothetical protein
MEQTPDEPPLLSRETIYSLHFLDALRDALHAWSVSLFDAETGGFRQNAAVGVNPLSSTDLIWMRYATNDSDVGAPNREAVIAYLQGNQEPGSGRISYGPAGQGHVDAHAFWQTVRALNILGAQLAHPPRYLAHLLTPDGLTRWFDSLDWNAMWRPGNTTAGNHHEVLGIIPVLASLSDPEWTEVCFQKIAEQQDQTTGAWPVGKPNISRTFAYTALYLAAGRIPPLPERVLDVMLELQQPDGVWENPLARFHTMDAIYVLTRLPGHIGGYRAADAHAGLVRASNAMRERFVQHQAQYLDNPHHMLSLTHSFGLLQETFPDEYPSQRPYRFDWDVPALYEVDAITPDMEAES